MNDTLEFRFVTRTRSRDYRVFGDGGKALFSDGSEFEPLRRRGRIIPEEGPCAVLFEENGKIFLVASGLRRGTKDVAGRPIRFSFCQIFAGNGPRERERAHAAFTRLTCEWPEAEETVRSLIHELPAEVQGDSDEGVRFDQEAFMRWLQEKNFPGPEVRPRSCEEGSVYPAGACVWPAKGCLLRWTEERGGVIVCERVNGPGPQIQSRSERGPVVLRAERPDHWHSWPGYLERGLRWAQERRLLVAGTAAAVLFLLAGCSLLFRLFPGSAPGQRPVPDETRPPAFNSAHTDGPSGKKFFSVTASDDEIIISLNLNLKVKLKKLRTERPEHE